MGGLLIILTSSKPNLTQRTALLTIFENPVNVLRNQDGSAAVFLPLLKSMVCLSVDHQLHVVRPYDLCGQRGRGGDTEITWQLKASYLDVVVSVGFERMEDFAVDWLGLFRF